HGFAARHLFQIRPARTTEVWRRAGNFSYRVSPGLFRRARHDAAAVVLGYYFSGALVWKMAAPPRVHLRFFHFLGRGSFSPVRGVLFLRRIQIALQHGGGGLSDRTK